MICRYEHITHDVEVELEHLPSCHCGAPTVVSWAHGQPPGTDVLGVEHYSNVLGISYTSSRDRDQKMKARGYEPGANVRGGPMSQSNHLPKNFGPKNAQWHKPGTLRPRCGD